MRKSSQLLCWLLMLGMCATTMIVCTPETMAANVSNKHSCCEKMGGNSQQKDALPCALCLRPTLVKEAQVKTAAPQMQLTAWVERQEFVMPRMTRAPAQAIQFEPLIARGTLLDLRCALNL